jgi:hypothetical protein
MPEKTKFELEYLLHTSPRVLENMLFTPSGLSEWFADDVNIKDDLYTFIWNDSEEKARLISKKIGERIKWQKLEDEEEGLNTYFELSYELDSMTKAIVLTITDFEEEDELEEAKDLWEHLITELKRTLGA